MDLKEFIKGEAVRQGFDYVGFITPTQSSFCKEVKEWVVNGMHGDMGWFARNIETRLDPRKLFEEIKTIIVLGVSYVPPKDYFDPKKANDPSRGIIARYALFDDYHKVIERALNNLIESIKTKCEKDSIFRAYVDTGPILERECAERGGIGYIGNNKNLITNNHGSYVFLSEIVCSIYIEPDELFSQSQQSVQSKSCNQCIRCRRACPTVALGEDGFLDSRKCISYLTIEYKGVIPDEYEEKIGNRIYGCDTCQEVCPWNRSSNIEGKISSFFSFRDDLVYPFLLDCIEITDSDFIRRFNNSPIKRIKHCGFIRNILGAIGCWGSKEALPHVVKKLFDNNEVVRATAVRAMTRIIKKNPGEKKECSIIIEKAFKEEDSSLVRGFFKSFFG